MIVSAIKAVQRNVSPNLDKTIIASSHNNNDHFDNYDWQSGTLQV